MHFSGFFNQMQRSTAPKPVNEHFSHELTLIPKKPRFFRAKGENFYSKLIYFRILKIYVIDL